MKIPYYELPNMPTTFIRVTHLPWVAQPQTKSPENRASGELIC